MSLIALLSTENKFVSADEPKQEHTRYSYCKNSLRQKILTVKIQYGENSIRRNFRTVRNLYCKNFIMEKILRQKIPTVKSLTAKYLAPFQVSTTCPVQHPSHSTTTVRTVCLDALLHLRLKLKSDTTQYRASHWFSTAL